MRNIDYSVTIPLYIVLMLIFVTTHSVYASEDLWKALKEGGKVVLIRHAPVEMGAAHGNPLLRDPSCKHERNLSTQGKLDAELVGSRFREHNISVSEVLHSPFCRTTDTAQFAFGKASPAAYLSLLEILGPEEAVRQTEILIQIIGSYVGDGNLVLVTHEPNIRAISFELMQHLDLLIVEPKGQGVFEELGVIRFTDSK